MSNDSKGEQALALIAALQTILDNLSQATDVDETTTTDPDDDMPPVPNPTHELFVSRLDQQSLASLFASIRILHKIHSKIEQQSPTNQY